MKCLLVINSLVNTLKNQASTLPFSISEKECILSSISKSARPQKVKSVHILDIKRYTKNNVSCVLVVVEMLSPTSIDIVHFPTTLITKHTIPQQICQHWSWETPNLISLIIMIIKYAIFPLVPAQMFMETFILMHNYVQVRKILTTDLPHINYEVSGSTSKFKFMQLAYGSGSVHNRGHYLSCRIGNHFTKII